MAVNGTRPRSRLWCAAKGCGSKHFRKNTWLVSVSCCAYRSWGSFTARRRRELHRLGPRSSLRSRSSARRLCPFRTLRAAVRTTVPRQTFHVSPPRPLDTSPLDESRARAGDSVRQGISKSARGGMEHAVPSGELRFSIRSPAASHLLPGCPTGATRRRAIGVLIRIKGVSLMNIIGISGLENSVPFKKKHWPGLDDREYRMSQGHDAAAALVVDGVVVAAAAEERFNRKKHCGDFPRQAIEYCLKEAGLGLDEVDEIAHGFDYAPYAAAYSIDPVGAACYREVYSKEALLQSVRRHLSDFPLDRVQQVSHHISH